MIRILAFAALLSAATAAAAAPSSLTAGFLLNRNASGEASLRLVHREAGDNSSETVRLPLRELAGLAGTGLDAGKIHFSLHREAGDLDCGGLASHGQAVGECRFSASTAYSDTLARHRIPRPTLRQQYHLAVQGVGLSLVEALDRQGYEPPGIGDLIAAGVFKIDAAYVQGLAAVGCRARKLDQLVAFKVHGVTPDYVRGLAAADRKLAEAEASDIVALRIHKVTPEWVRQQAAGYGDLTAEQLVALRLTGFGPRPRK